MQAGDEVPVTEGEGVGDALEGALGEVVAIARAVQRNPAVALAVAAGLLGWSRRDAILAVLRRLRPGAVKRSGSR